MFNLIRKAFQSRPEPQVDQAAVQRVLAAVQAAVAARDEPRIRLMAPEPVRQSNDDLELLWAHAD